MREDIAEVWDAALDKAISEVNEKRMVFGFSGNAAKVVSPSSP